MANPLCIGPNARGWYMGNDVGDRLSVLTIHVGSMVKDSLSWRKHVNLAENETFRVKAENPTGVNLSFRMDLVIFEPDGCNLFFGSPSFSLNAGERTEVSFSFSPDVGPGKYCFAASLVYGVDTDKDGVLAGSEPSGAATGHTGCFNYG